MSFKFNSIALLLSSLLTGAGAWAGYELYKPKIIKDLAGWKGLKLASENNDNLWKALYFQKQDKLNTKNIKDFLELKKFCVDSWKKSVSEIDLVKDVEDFCIEALSNRKVRIIVAGLDEKKLLGGEVDDEDYKVAFIFNRYSPTFLELLGSGLSKTSESKDALKAYKDYCEKALSEDSSEYIQRTYQICQKPEHRTGEALLASEGYTDLTQQEIEEVWSELNKLPELQGNTLLHEIQDEKKPNNWMDLKKHKDQFSASLKKWCDVKKKTKLSEEKYYPEIYSAVKSRCVRKRDKNTQK